MHGIEEADRLLRAQRFAQRREVAHIHEQHGDLAVDAAELQRLRALLDACQQGGRDIAPEGLADIAALALDDDIPERRGGKHGQQRAAQRQHRVEQQALGCKQQPAHGGDQRHQHARRDEAGERADEAGNGDQQQRQRGDGQHLRAIDPGGAGEELARHDLADDLGMYLDARHRLAKRRHPDVLQARGGHPDEHDGTLDLLGVGPAGENVGSRDDGCRGFMGRIEADLALLVRRRREVGDAQ